jgi:serine/threonine protein phosphatase 1
MPRTLAIGDIHGCLSALKTLAEFARFDDSDRLVTLGDYVDRGPDSADALDWVISRFEAGQLTPLRGNHEVMMLAALDGADASNWLTYGGRETLQSYARREFGGTLDDIPERHIRFIRDDCLPIFETERHIFVHAAVQRDLPVSEQPDWVIYWERWNDPPLHVSGKSVICGHTAQRSGLPASNDCSCCIDTGVYRTGWLTCLDVDSGQFWQAHVDGGTRTDWL